MHKQLFGPRSLTILACCLVSAVLGSIHAFSVFIPEWESLTNDSRAKVNLIYSIALLCLTLSVLWGYKLFVRFSPLAIFLSVSLGTGAGLWSAATAESTLALYLSYGCLFGAANGLGYGYALQLAGQAASKHHTMAMSLTTASYALGAIISPPILLALITSGGNELALKSSAITLAFVIGIGACIIATDGATYYNKPGENQKTLDDAQKRIRFLAWLAYGLAVFAGLMIIGHAYTLAEWYGYKDAQLMLVPVLLSLGNLIGGCIAGYIAIRIGTRIIIQWLPILSALAIAGLCLVSLFTSVQADRITAAFAGNYLAMVFPLMVVGFTYGATIALYPVLIFDLYGKALSAKIYGQVFTAWGVSGLLAPTVAGTLYDRFSSYLPALLAALFLSLLSTLIIKRLPVKTLES